MEWENLLNVILNNGIGIACLVYFMTYFKKSIENLANEIKLTKEEDTKALNELTRVIDRQNILLQQVLNLKTELLKKED